MKSEYAAFVNLQRQIFGLCPHCDNFFRLSDCRIYSTKRPGKDWMDTLEAESERLDRMEQRIDEKEDERRERAREKGRKAADRSVRRLDRVFTPRKLNPDDAKVIFHPIDYVVFKGMTSGVGIREVIMLDGEGRSKEHRQLQRSVERVIERGDYEWVTLRVQDDGSISEE